MRSDNSTAMVAHERCVLRKFEGDRTPDSVPFEVVLIEDGKVTHIWVGEDVGNAPTQ